MSDDARRQQATAMLRADRAVYDEEDMAWVIAQVAERLAVDHGSQSDEFSDQVENVLGTLVALGVDPTALRRVMTKCGQR